MSIMVFGSSLLMTEACRPGFAIGHMSPHYPICQVPLGQ